MLYRTHLAFGFLSGLLFWNYWPGGNVFVFFGLVLLGALLPDIDQGNSKISQNFGFLSKMASFLGKHRGIFHSLFVPLLIGVLLWQFSHIYTCALLTGYISHLFIDGWTRQGINYLHPVAQLSTRGFIETGSVVENLIFLAIIVSIVVLVI